MRYVYDLVAALPGWVLAHPWIAALTAASAMALGGVLAVVNIRANRRG